MKKPTSPAKSAEVSVTSPEKKEITYTWPKPKVMTVSDARINLYEIVRNASRGMGPYEITQRGGESAVIMSREDYEGWLETLDIMSNPEEVASLRRSLTETKLIPFKRVIEELEAENGNTI